MNNNGKYILIDPENKTITEGTFPLVQDDNMWYVDFMTIDRLLGCNCMTTAGKISHKGIEHTAWVDDEGYLKENKVTNVTFYPAPLAGRILISGSEPDARAFSLTVEDVKGMVTWTESEADGVEATTEGDTTTLRPKLKGKITRENLHPSVVEDTEEDIIEASLFLFNNIELFEEIIKSIKTIKFLQQVPFMTALHLFAGKATDGKVGKPLTDVMEPYVKEDPRVIGFLIRTIFMNRPPEEVEKCFTLLMVSAKDMLDGSTKEDIIQMWEQSVNVA
jgi:hypothetical protein